MNSNLFRLHSYSAMLLALAFTCGCGGGGGSTSQGSQQAGFTVAGKITRADGTPLPGVSVKLIKSTYSIYSTTGFYTTRNAQGNESLTDLFPPVDTQSTSTDGSFSFNSITAGNYTIKPESTTYLFKWKLIPTRNNIGVVTLTDTAMAYFYNPDGNGNQLSADRTIIFNTAQPALLTGNILKEQNFEASLPGGASN